ncbi:MAG TPA: hypothetical protein EYO08_04110, partial [Candidatus Marinimicrobia bacterium]|nr:hypothetical protein [Candidatus Neomarinimicrobiota bacterium]
MSTSYDSAKLQDQISSTCIDLIMEDAFFGHFLLSINREISEDGPTLWVRPSSDDKVLMGINPNFWTTELKKKDFRMGCIKHEVLHVVFKHLTRAQERSGGRRQYPNAKLFNIAADLVVNQYVESSWLIDGAVKLQSFPDLNLRKEMDVSYYYNKLDDFYKDQMGNLPQEAQSSSDLGESGDGTGKCPSCGKEIGESDDESGDESGGGSGDSEDGESSDESGDESGGGSGDSEDGESSDESGDESGGGSGDSEDGESSDESGDESGGGSGDSEDGESSD